MVSLPAFAATFITLSTLLFPVSGSPTPPAQSVGQDSAALNIIEPRSVSCFPLDLQQVSRLPAWNKVVQYAEDQFGKGAQFRLNDPQYPDRIADGCMNAASIPIQYNGQPRCSTSNRQIQGSSDGTNQTITFIQTIGNESKTSWTVTKESTLAVHAEFKAEFDFPAVAKFEASLSTTGTFRNERTNTFDTTYTSKQETKFEFINRDGFDCRFEVETTSCAMTAMASAPVIATGTVLAAFDNKRKRKGNGSEGAHYHWFIDFETVLTPEERTSWVDFQGPVSVTSTTAYQTNCVRPGESLPHLPNQVKVIAQGTKV
ncbi:hypothetical protein DFP72DRAFT_898247 [Ephemerocybe angulata]|uniref:Uncharacterized protein n=1 Tax=Ephemerocybe angulata TaxID=980116 RepID=A0A8H6M534_9AGAR|nr:hypothetical protein DFP72DRAFT_898247 [Tulosesus angulatus]